MAAGPREFGAGWSRSARETAHQDCLCMRMTTERKTRAMGQTTVWTTNEATGDPLPVWVRNGSRDNTGEGDGGLVTNRWRVN